MIPQGLKASPRAEFKTGEVDPGSAEQAAALA
jgi:hypothetical protein